MKMSEKMKNSFLILMVLFLISGYVIGDLSAQVIINTLVEHSYVEVDFSLFSGHTILVDTNYSDWKGVQPSGDNSAVYSSNEYIYKDAYYDDTGDGDYAYPTGGHFKRGMADIVQFRVTYDTTNLYFYVNLLDASPDPADGWWVNGFVMGIHDSTAEGGNNFLIQGNGVDPDSGPAAEINTKEKIHYTLFASSTYKIRMWNASGVKIGDGNDGDNSDGTLNNIRIKAKEWNKYEVGIPFSLIGPVAGKKLKFLVGSCFEEGNMVREVQGYPLSTEWYITGGDKQWWVNTGPDPDVMDLIGAAKDLQQKDLGNYREIFFNAEFDFEVFNMDIRPYIFSPGKSETVTIYFTFAKAGKVTLRVRDLNGRSIRTIEDGLDVAPEAENNLYIEKTWDGRDNDNTLLDRGAYIIEAVFADGKEEKISRKVVRVW
ncbi:MAG: hypothetical protein KKH98_10180 [Spirochaetes bacterium]|nr:hypothetical protein [Spirochaetota bacterium]